MYCAEMRVRFPDESFPAAMVSYLCGVVAATIFFSPSYREYSTFLTFIGVVLIVPFVLIFLFSLLLRSSLPLRTVFKYVNALDLSAAFICVWFLVFLDGNGNLARSMSLTDPFSVFFYFPLITCGVSCVLYKIILKFRSLS